MAKIPLLGLACAAMLSCGSPASEDPELGRLAKEAAARGSEFAFELFARLPKDENVFVSPASVTLALTMAQAGAAGATREEMSKVLHWDGAKQEDVDRQCAALLAVLKSADPLVRLEIADSAWARKGFPFRKEYISLLDERYEAKAEELDFDSPKAAAAMNDWVKSHTAGRIEKIVPDKIPPAAVLHLINAVYFKGEWKDKFEKSATRPQPFHLLKGGTKDFPFMVRVGSYGYLEETGVRAIRMPYGKKGRMAFYVLLPNGSATLSDLRSSLTEANWKAWREKFSSRECALEMPRFKLEWAAELGPILQELGMASAFKPKAADFSGLSTRGKELYIGSVRHKTFVEVNEEGTEAAAVTSVAVEVLSEPPPPIPFKVDRPFVCILRDDETGAILFMGSIIDPA